MTIIERHRPLLWQVEIQNVSQKLLFKIILKLVLQRGNVTVHWTPAAFFYHAKEK